MTTSLSNVPNVEKNGKEIMVDLVELAKDENFDLYGISARCVNCSKKIVDKIYSKGE